MFVHDDSIHVLVASKFLKKSFHVKPFLIETIRTNIDKAMPMFHQNVFTSGRRMVPLFSLHLPYVNSGD